MSEKPTSYRIRWEHDDSTHQLSATANIADATVTVTMPDGQRLRIDATSARALPMILSHIVYVVLQPTGPWLTIEAQRGDRWSNLRPSR